ncbi:MAG: TAXI family TRAP transporter solute-binding subunit [Tissierellia bacterium]|nr:TAXI family TRAP transporter solute-binding subunit [Tissierellia bacterium]
MFKKPGIKILLVILLIALVTGCTSKGAENDKEAGTNGGTQYISIATGGPAGTYYPLGGALAKIFNDNIDGVTANAQSTGASAENVGLISKGDAEVAFIQNDITYYAFTGTETFEGKEKIENMRGMAMVYPELVQIIATKESEIKSVDDLKGKKVAIGAPGSGVEANARQVLDIHGLSYDDLGKADYLSFNEAADQLKNKQIDAAFITAGIPTSAVTEVAQTSDIVVIPIESDKIDELIEKYPYYTEVDIPKGTYKGQEHDNPTIAVMAMLVVPEELDEDLVYNMTKTMFEQRQVIIDTHDRGNDIQLETALTGMPIDVHPGAMRYYEEQGISK